MDKKLKIQNIVLGNLMSEWNDSLSFAKILEAIKDEDWDQVTPCEAIQDVSGQDMANIVCDMVRDLNRLFEEVQNAN